MKDAKLKVAEEQLHIPAGPSEAGPSEAGLLDVMAKDAPVIRERDRKLDNIRVAARSAKRPRVARAKVSATKPDGSIPVTLGGKLPPVSVLSRREFGLRALRR